LPVYSPDVQVFEFTREGQKIGLMYVDLFSRLGSKRDGAWMNPWTNQKRGPNGERIPPIVSINANFKKAENEGRTNLSLNDAITIFHEFGHGLHGMLSDVDIPPMGGINVTWDFVELPSQFMENFMAHPEVLALYAFNENGEVLPNEYVKALKDSEKVGAAWGLVTQLRMSVLDMAYFTLPQIDLSLAESNEALLNFERQFTAHLQLVQPTGLERPSIASFSHIVSGGYSAGYHGYTWAAVLDKHAFEPFRISESVLSREWGQKFEIVLKSGDTIAPAPLYQMFRGEPVSVDPFLRSKGIIE